MISNKIAINESLILSLKFHIIFKKENYSCFRKNNLVIYLFSGYAEVQRLNRFCPLIFYLDKVQSFINYIKMHDK